MDADAGPIIANLSPSGTAFMVGSATCFGDTDVRRSLIKTAEIAGSTFYGFTENHYLLANFALVGEAVMLAMRTNVNGYSKASWNLHIKIWISTGFLMLNVLI